MGTVLVTGVAGFIGYHLSERLLADGHRVVGIDIVNDYYDVRLKEARLERLSRHPGFDHRRIDLADDAAVAALFAEVEPERVVNLAAQAGVRYSLTKPHTYVSSNVRGFLNILEGCRHHGVKHLLYASSSSVYGSNTTMPFSEHHPVDHPVSLYAATKKSNEMMAHAYSHLFGIPTSGLRFFTVYGPWGRPDMALFKFAKAILADEPIDVYNHGKMERDFTYVDDVVEGVVRLLEVPPTGDPSYTGAHPTDPCVSAAPFKVYNIGNHTPVQLMYMIECLEKSLGRKAEYNMMPMQPGDVPATSADVSELYAAVGWQPSTPIEVGVDRFVAWYLEHYA
ncbi:MAG: NAD-dependent epimerase [Alphaproteobacteria bacterium]|nr:NAD-dependent epimerase [Alphaproteobacteria bacterium]